MKNPEFDAVILGAGIAGMSAAFELRDKRILILEARDRVGGRTYSMGDEKTWYNFGAQIVTSQRLLDLCEELGLETVPISGADFAVGIDDKYARASTPEKLFMRMPLSIANKIDFAFAVLRLRRLLHRIPNMTSEQKNELDGKSLSQVIGRVSPMTAQILNGFCEGAAGVSANEVSALMGVVYGLGAYIDPKSSKTSKAVRGGTQLICTKIAEKLPSDAIRLSAEVTNINQIDGVATIHYKDESNKEHTVVTRNVVCAVPAGTAAKIIDDLEPEMKKAMLDRTPYGAIISVAWPVKDGVKTPWDGSFFLPISGKTPFSLFTNYSYLGKLQHPEFGGHVVTIANAQKAQSASTNSDQEIVDSYYAHLVRLFPEARTLIDPSGAKVYRWYPVGLPWMRPGSFANRSILRQAHGAVRFCGDYTSEPGLAGANNSGFHVGRTVAKLMEGLGVN